MKLAQRFFMLIIGVSVAALTSSFILYLNRIQLSKLARKNPIMLRNVNLLMTNDKGQMTALAS